MSSARVTETAQQYTQRILSNAQGHDPIKLQSATNKKLTRLIKGVPTAKLRKRPAPDKWSVAEILAHLADVEIVIGWRMRSILGDPGTAVQAYDQNAWVVSGHYEKRDSRKSIEIHRGGPGAKTIATPQTLFAAAATVERSTSTVLFAVFIMVFMWCLTIAALIAAWYTASGRLGLFWSALGFLGTLLFALIPLRNAVPGDPPIGSLIDFAAFFIAEGVVSISMIVTVLHGYHIEISHKKRKAASDD